MLNAPDNRNNCKVGLAQVPQNLCLLEDANTLHNTLLDLWYAHLHQIASRFPTGLIDPALISWQPGVGHQRGRPS